MKTFKANYNPFRGSSIQEGFCGPEDDFNKYFSTEIEAYNWLIEMSDQRIKSISNQLYIATADKENLQLIFDELS